MKTSNTKHITAADFDLAFNQEDILDHLEVKSVKTRQPVQRISIDFPKNMLEEVDVEAAKIGVTRTSLIKMWISQQLLRA